MSLRLTDQALVAWTAAGADPRGAEASVGDLLVALASSEGVAAQRLAPHAGAVARLAERAPALSGVLAPARVAAGWAGREVTSRPVATADLLAAAVEVGGGDLRDACQASGLPLAALGHGDPWSLREPGALAETYALPPQGAPGWGEAALRALARARAAGGSATALAVALALDPASPTGDVDRMASLLEARFADRDWRPLACASADDAGVSAVVAAVERAFADQRIGAPALAQATLIAGGPLPAALLSPPRGSGGASPTVEGTSS